MTPDEERAHTRPWAPEIDRRADELPVDTPLLMFEGEPSIAWEESADGHADDVRLTAVRCGVQDFGSSPLTREEAVDVDADKHLAGEYGGDDD